MKVGVLALQGAFREHAEALDALGARAVLVKRSAQVDSLDALVVPGGESTTLCRLLDTSDLRKPLRRALRDGLPALGTCAGLIVFAAEVRDGRADQQPLGVLDVSIRRNGYGRQRDSFEAVVEVADLGSFPGVFIRAPVIERVGPEVEVLAWHEDIPVLVRERGIYGSSFHPELSGDLRLHQRFLSEVPA